MPVGAGQLNRQWGWVSRLLELSTGCRLHFGLLELAAGQPNRYGGLGLMLDAPQLRLRLHTSPTQTPTSHASVSLASSVELERRIRLAQTHALSAIATRRVEQASSHSIDVPGVIEVLECPPLHSGLGVGTQLGTAVAQLTALALDEQYVTSRSSHANAVAHLAWLSGRGKRSAIGLHGFLHGGLVRDLGYDTASSQAHSVRPVHTESLRLPPDWLVVLCCSWNSGDVHGQLEDQLIDRAAARANPARQRMLDLSQAALTAAAADDFGSFTQFLDEYMELASRLFAHVQSGRYRDAVIAQRVEQLKAAGLCGVGQSSWGPTVFGFAPNEHRAQDAADQLARTLDTSLSRIIIARPKASGAQWSMTSSSSTGGKQHAG